MIQGAGLIYVTWDVLVYLKLNRCAGKTLYSNHSGKAIVLGSCVDTVLPLQGVRGSGQLWRHHSRKARNGESYIDTFLETGRAFQQIYEQVS